MELLFIVSIFGIIASGLGMILYGRPLIHKNSKNYFIDYVGFIISVIFFVICALSIFKTVA